MARTIETPNLDNNYKNEEFLSKAILARIIETVDAINEYISGLIVSKKIFSFELLS